MLMKSFSVFITESRAVFNRTEREAEASKRSDQAEKFKEESKEKVAKTKQVAAQKFASQLKQAKKLKKSKKLQKKISQQKASQTSHNLTQAVKGTVKLVKGIARAVKNKKQNSTPSP